MDGINEITAHNDVQYDVPTHFGYSVLDPKKKMIFFHHGTT